MKKQLIISRDRQETRVALLEDGKAAELYVERRGCPSIVGNIYKGRVENVLAGMDAAFVNIGLERNGFLYVDEVSDPDERGKGKRKITCLLQGGKEVLVQVARDAMGNKGPRLTTQPCLAGRLLVLMPLATGSGVSRRLGQEERDRLRSVCGELDQGKAGLIARTAAEGATADALRRDLRFLRRMWEGVERRAAAEQAPALVYREPELAMRSVRDLLGTEFGTVTVDDAGLQRRLVNYVHAVAPELSGRVELYEGDAPLFDSFGLESEFEKALARRIGLPSGGYIVVDHTEAMTVIDVNTGSYVRGRFLEDTTLKTNVEACHEIVRQLRLRDIGGIIVIDFIDMAVESNREAVLVTLKAALAQDRTKSYVVEISPLGLVEMTRQNTVLGLRDVVTVTCPTCRGEGRVVSEEAALAGVERSLRRLSASSARGAIRVEVHPRIAVRLVDSAAAGHGSGRGENAPGTLLEVIEAETGRRILLQSASVSVPLDHCTIVRD